MSKVGCVVALWLLAVAPLWAQSSWHTGSVAISGRLAPEENRPQDARPIASAEEEALWRACQRETLNTAPSQSACYRLQELRAERGYIEVRWQGQQYCSYDAWDRLLGCF